MAAGLPMLTSLRGVQLCFDEVSEHAAAANLGIFIF